MKHLFIPYELAVIAKEKGFDEPCFANYFDKEFIYPLHASISYREKIEAPLYQQIVDWFSERHNLIFIPAHRMNGDVKNYWYSISEFEKSPVGIKRGKVGMIQIGCHLTNEAAINKAIEEAFKLIPDKR
jgi:hypothetical protein